MKVLKATAEQKEALEGIYLNGSQLKFIQDKNGFFVVNENVLFDPDFINILETLSDLKRVEFEPPEVE